MDGKTLTLSNLPNEHPALDLPPKGREELQNEREWREEGNFQFLSLFKRELLWSLSSHQEFNSGRSSYQLALLTC